MTTDPNVFFPASELARCMLTKNQESMAGTLKRGGNPNSKRLLPLSQFRRPSSERLGTLETRALNSRLDSRLNSSPGNPTLN